MGTTVSETLMSQDADDDATEFSGSSVVQGKGGMFPQQKSEKSLENDDQSADFGVPHLWKKNHKSLQVEGLWMFRTWKRDGS